MRAVSRRDREEAGKRQNRAFWVYAGFLSL